MYCIGLFFTLNTVAVFLSIGSSFNSYVQVYDSLGSIIVADFVIPSATLQANTGIIGLDRIRWLGSGKQVYEYHFDQAQITNSNVFQIWKDSFSVGKVDSNGAIMPLGEFQSSRYLLYE